MASSLTSSSFKDGELISVGEYYPGFCGPYDYGRQFIGYKFQRDKDPAWPMMEGTTEFMTTYPYWAWPICNKDIIERDITTIKCSLYATTLSGVSKEKSRLGFISEIYAGPYLRKIKALDDGREISCGPELIDNKNQHPTEREKSYLDTYYIIVIESERIEKINYILW